MADRIHTPPGVARYCNLLQPRQRKDAKGANQGTPKYSLVLIFDDDVAAMKKAALAVGVEKFGPKFQDLVKKGKINWPFVKNTDAVDDDDERRIGFENDDGVHVRLSSTDKPGIVDADAEPIMDKSEVYDGMLARASCRPFAYDNESKGVGFYLINVQKLEDGDRLSGDPSAEDDFKPAKKTAAKKSKKSTDDDDDNLL